MLNSNQSASNNNKILSFKYLPPFIKHLIFQNKFKKVDIINLIFKFSVVKIEIGNSH